MRAIWRHRQDLIQMACAHVQHMQKSLDQMNLQLHHVISDLTGLTGLRIVRDILAGERDPAKLAAHRDARIKASAETIQKALVGNYRPEHLFTLGQALQMYEHYQHCIADCDRQMEEMLQQYEGPDEPPAAPLGDPQRTRPKRDKNEPRFDMRSHLYRIFGVDLTRIPGVNVRTASVLLTEVGPDLSRFRSAGAFCSWLGQCPQNAITGGKVIKRGTRKVKNRLAGAFRVSAQTLHHSQSALGAYYRRMRAKQGAPKAITSTAHKLGRIIYHMITKRQEYDESIFLQHDEAYRRRAKARVDGQARALGYRLVPLEEAA